MNLICHHDLDIEREIITIDIDQCDHLAKLLKSIPLPPDGEDQKLIEMDNDILKNFYFIVTSICHQTTSPDGRNLEGLVCGRKLKGWDYLNARFQIAIGKDASLISPSRLSTITTEDIVEIFRDDRGSSTISNPEKRASLLRDIGQKMLDLEFDTVEKLYEKSKGFLISENKTGLLQQLSIFKAYSDPVRKKSLFFLSLMENHSLWSFLDAKNLGPPVDYHEVRGHLRLGTVKIVDEKLLKQISKNVQILQEQDIAIRKTVYDAIMHIVCEANIPASILHYFFWNLFRSCCTRYNPHCNMCPDNCALPVRYSELKRHSNVDRCLLSCICESKYAERKLMEPRVETKYY